MILKENLDAKNFSLLIFVYKASSYGLLVTTLFTKNFFSYLMSKYVL